MDLPPLSPDGPEYACHLFYRPLREGPGEGPPAPWTVETFDDSDGAAQCGLPKHHRGGPAKLARGGGRWLAFVTCSGLGWNPELCGPIIGEYLVRDGNVEPLATVEFRWPIKLWERGVRSAMNLLNQPGIPPDLLVEAMIAWLRAATERLSRVEPVTIASIDVWEARLRLVRAGAPARPLPTDIGPQNAWLGGIDESVRYDPRGEAPPGREAWVAAWERDSVAVVQRVVGDAWFIARASPEAAR